MKIFYNTYIVLALCMLMFTACSKDDDLDINGNSQGKELIHLAVNSGVASFSVEESRSTNIGKSDSIIGREVGVFIMNDKKEMPAANGYGYENIRMRVGNDGKLVNISETPELLYPSGQNEKITVIAVSPFIPAMKWADLKEFTCQVSVNQSVDDAVYGNDLLMGKVEPVRQDVVEIGLKHLLSEIKVSFAIVDSIKNEKDSMIVDSLRYLCDSVKMYMNNAPLASQVFISKDSIASVKKQGVIEMAKITARMDTDSIWKVDTLIEASAIVAPHTSTNISFTLDFYKDGSKIRTYTTKTIKSVCNSGCSVSYKGEIAPTTAHKISSCIIRRKGNNE